jgi:hypothetical protein
MITINQLLQIIRRRYVCDRRHYPAYNIPDSELGYSGRDHGAIEDVLARRDIVSSMIKRVT